MRFSYPKEGYYKTTKFLWFPMTILGETRWLEKATYEYEIWYHVVADTFTCHKRNVKWLNK